MTKTYETKTGFLLTIGTKQLFIETDITKRTAKLACEAIEHAGKYLGLCKDLIERIKNNPEAVKRIQKELDAATITRKYTDGVGAWYSVVGRDFGGGYDIDEIIMIVR